MSPPPIEEFYYLIIAGVAYLAILIAYNILGVSKPKKKKE